MQHLSEPLLREAGLAGEVAEGGLAVHEAGEPQHHPPQLARLQPTQGWK